MKMPQVDSLEDLMLQKEQLIKRRDQLEEEMEVSFNEAKEQLSPGNLVKAAWKSIASKNNLTSINSLNSLMAIGSEFLYRKIAKGKSATPLYSAGFLAAKYALRYAMKNKRHIYAAFSGVAKTFSTDKKKGNATFDQSTAGDGYYF
ncbi:MAG: hypothetical protein JSS90_05015 [Bacteroidetes bacterium]|jgi:hypothetical protein|nr:hypothetical protein [Bacteroidota bacterium]